jgi:hypothetical protein
LTRLVVDASIWLPAFVAPDESPPARLFDALMDVEFESIVCPTLLDEIRRGLTRPYFRDRLPEADAADSNSLGRRATGDATDVRNRQHAPTIRCMSAEAVAITATIQRELKRRGMSEVAAVEAARWLDKAGILRDSRSRPGLPLRERLRVGEIDGADQRPAQRYGRWFIRRTAT